MLCNFFAQTSNKTEKIAQSLLMLLLLIVPLSEQALAINEQGFPTDIVKSRAKYQEAMGHLKANRISAFNKLKDQLIDYPLYPYLEYEFYRKRLNQMSEYEALAFRDNHADSPMSKRFHSHWLEHLFDTKRYGLYLTHYVPEVNRISTKFECYQGRAFYELGDEFKAFRIAERLWLIGNSQDHACDPLFKAWQSKGFLTESKVWKRIQLAMRAGNQSLAKFLAKELEHPLRDYQFKLWLSIYNNPSRLSGLLHRFKDRPVYREIMLQGFKRWIRTDKDGTLNYLPKYLANYNFTNQELDEYLNYIARYISFSYHPEAYYWLLQADHNSTDAKVHQRRLMVSIWESNWAGVLTWTHKPTTDSDETLKNLYLYTRALEQLSADWSKAIISQPKRSNNRLSNHPFQLPSQPGHLLHTHNKWAHWLSHPEGIVHILNLGKTPQALSLTALKNYRKLYAYRKYYGFLASERLQQPLSMHANIERFPVKEVNKVKQLKGMQRAYEFFMLDDKLNAAREWYMVTKRLSAKENAIAARIADNWGWHFQAILTSTKSNQRDNLDIRFPRAYQNYVGYYANQVGITTDWVFSVIRQESAFKTYARSGVGAMGMMQLMPNTAKYVSKKIGVPYKGRNSLLDPKTNIKLGTAYLKDLYKQFDNNILMATAAYNAGPHRVKKWRPKQAGMPGDLWIETIPFDETQHYVKNIVTYQAIYRYQMGQEPKLTTDIAWIGPKPINGIQRSTLKKNQLASIK